MEVRARADGAGMAVVDSGNGESVISPQTQTEGSMLSDDGDHMKINPPGSRISDGDNVGGFVLYRELV